MDETKKNTIDLAESLPMPSDLVRETGAGGATGELGEPPSVKLIVRLFLIPALIVAAAVGVVFLIGLLAGRAPTLEQSLEGLRSPGGGRTTDYLIGPGSKQRYLYAKTLADHMKQGLDEAQRIALADELIDILDHHTQPGEGEVQHFLLLALGRAWQTDPRVAGEEREPAAAAASRQRVVDALMRYARHEELEARKAAILSLTYMAQHEEAQRAIPPLIERLGDPREVLDVRLSAATALGPLGRADDQRVIDALRRAMRTEDARDAELVWSSALSLAQLNQPDAADTVLKLLDRDELSQMRYYDRETDPKNPSFRSLNDQEQQRFLINTMLGAQHLDVPAVQQRLRELAESDPSPRVRAAAREILARRG